MSRARHAFTASLETYLCWQSSVRIIFLSFGFSRIIFLTTKLKDQAFTHKTRKEGQLFEMKLDRGSVQPAGRAGTNEHSNHNGISNWSGNSRAGKWVKSESINRLERW